MEHCTDSEDVPCTVLSCAMDFTICMFVSVKKINIKVINIV